MRTDIKPTVPTYYLAYSDGVRHLGVTMPGELTTSGQANVEFDVDPDAFAHKIRNIDIPGLDEMPDAGQFVGFGVVRRGGKRFIVKSPHTRRLIDPEQDGEHFAHQDDPALEPAE